MLGQSGKNTPPTAGSPKLGRQDPLIVFSGADNGEQTTSTTHNQFNFSDMTELNNTTPPTAGSTNLGGHDPLIVSSGADNGEQSISTTHNQRNIPTTAMDINNSGYTHARTGDSQGAHIFEGDAVTHANDAEPNSEKGCVELDDDYISLCESVPTLGEGEVDSSDEGYSVNGADNDSVPPLEQ